MPLFIATVLLALVVPLPPQPEIKAPSYQVLTADVTAYSSDPAETWGDGTITKSGTHVHPGTLACPPDIAFGTQVQIATTTYTCEDRMSPKFSKRFDIWMGKKSDAVVWGIQKLPVKILLSTL